MTPGAREGQFRLALRPAPGTVGKQQRGVPFGAVEFVEEAFGKVLAAAVEEDPAALQGHRARAIAQRVVDLMQGHHHGLAVVAVDIGEDVHHLARRLRVERGDRFVGENHLGLLGQGAGDGHALLLAAGKGRGALPGEIGQADPRQRFQGLALLLGAEQPQRTAPARHATEEAEQDVVQHAEAVDQVELLEDVTDVGAQATHFAAQAAGRLQAATQHVDAAAVVAVAAGEPGDVTQERGFAGAGCTDQRHHLARLDLQPQVEKRLLAGKGLVQAVDTDHRAHRSPSNRLHEDASGAIWCRPR